MIYKEITVNAWQPPMGELRVIQEEADGRDLQITVLGTNGQPFDMTGTTVSAYVLKPDGTLIYNSCAVNGSVATVTLTGQMMAAAGKSKLFELHIVDSDDHTLKVTLPPLCIVPSDSIGAVESTDEFSRLAEIMNQVDDVPEVMEAVEQATQDAIDVKNDLIQKRDSGFFDGAPGPQGAQGIQGPQGEKGDKGDRGDSGIQTPVDGMYTLYVNESGHLIAEYADSGDPPPLSIVDGHLIYNTGE